MFWAISNKLSFSSPNAIFIVLFLKNGEFKCGKMNQKQ